MEKQPKLETTRGKRKIFTEKETVERVFGSYLRIDSNQARAWLIFQSVNNL
jgi:hypothetical protein